MAGILCAKDFARAQHFFFPPGWTLLYVISLGNWNRFCGSGNIISIGARSGSGGGGGGSSSSSTILCWLWQWL